MPSARSASKTPRRPSSGGGGLHKLAWFSIGVVVVAYGWFLFPLWNSGELISEAERKLQDISRENPNAEIFDVHSGQKKN